MEQKINKEKSIFLSRFYPTYMFDKVEDIPYELVKKEDIKLVMMDMDNTLIDCNKKYKKTLKEWVENVSNLSVKMCILSNSPFGDKVKKIAKELNVEYEYNAGKPLLKGFKKVIEKSKFPKENILMIGDQIFTDVWGGNRIGVKTVLVTPINKKESFLTKIKRPFEKIILRKIKGENK